MSLPILLTSDKTEFSNFLSDNIVVQENSEVALTKAVMSIPVAVNNFVTIPFIDTDTQLNNFVFRLDVDGLFAEITWADIYASYTILDGVNGFEPMTAAQFYSGSLQLPLNNFIIFRDLATLQLKRRGNICEIIAHAFNSKIAFYRINSSPKFSYNGYDNFEADGQLTFGGNTYIIESMQPFSMDLGFTAKYDPNAMATAPNLKLATGPLVWVNHNNTTVTDNAVDGCTVESTGVNPIAISDAQIDPNGGVLLFQLDTVPVGGTVFVGLRNGGTDLTSLATLAAPDIIDYEFGFLFTENGGQVTYQIYDGRKIPVHQGTNLALPDLHPENAVVNVAPTGALYGIGVRRTAKNQGDLRYHFSAYFNELSNDFLDANTELVYTSEKYINCTLNLNQIFDASGTGGRISKLRFTPLTLASQNQINRAKINFANNTGQNVTGIGMFKMDTVDDATETNLTPDVRTFYNTLGFHMDFEDGREAPSRDANNGYGKAITPFIYRQVISRPRGITMAEQQDNTATTTAVLFGENRLEKMLTPNTLGATGVPAGTFLVYRNINSTIPRVLDVKINDMPINDYIGQNVGAVNYSTTSVSRDVCHIPTPAEYLNMGQSFDMDISYEPYNLIYRRLENAQKLPVNQLQINISAKDFKTNRNLPIPVINGTVKLELHVKRSE